MICSPSFGKSIFYYPYASLGEKQLSLLKATALYFDKIYILDPLKSSWGGIGDAQYEGDVKMLEDEGFLQRLSPEEVMHKYEPKS